MKKISILLSCILILQTSFVTKTYAKSNQVNVTTPPFQVTINDSVIDSTNSDYPLLFFNGIVYYPLTYYGNKFVGLQIYNFDKENIRLMGDSDITFVGNSPITENEYFNYAGNYKNSPVMSAAILDGRIALNELRLSKLIENKKNEFSFLMFRGIKYLPLTYNFATEELDWNITFDTKKGLKIDSRDANRPFLNPAHISVNDLGMTNYVYGEDSYAGYPSNTFNGNYTFIYKERGQYARSFTISENIFNGDYYFNSQTTNGADIVESEIKPTLKNGVLSIHCVVFNNEGGQYYGKNFLVRIDMLNETIISAEKI